MAFVGCGDTSHGHIGSGPAAGPTGGQAGGGGTATGGAAGLGEAGTAGGAGKSQGGAGGDAAGAGGAINFCAYAEIATPCAADPSWPSGCCTLSGNLIDTLNACVRPGHLLFCSGACGGGELTACYEITRSDGHKDYLSTPTMRGVAPEMETVGIRPAKGGECSSFGPLPECE